LDENVAMEPRLTEDQNSLSRSEDRHSHISIGLRYRVNDKWERLDALGWNEMGFNFYHASELREPRLELKRGLARFEGTILWKSLGTDDDVLLAALLNELIFKRVQGLADNLALRYRLIKLIRIPGMAVQKRHVLASLGLDLSDEKLADMIAQRKLERPLFHYGVKVESDAWRAVVQGAFSISSVVISMEKWSAAFAKK
jgi:hypothetical protein